MWGDKRDYGSVHVVTTTVFFKSHEALQYMAVS